MTDPTRSASFWSWHSNCQSSSLRSFCSSWLKAKILNFPQAFNCPRILYHFWRIRHNPPNTLHIRSDKNRKMFSTRFYRQIWQVGPYFASSHSVSRFAWRAIDSQSNIRLRRKKIKIQIMTIDVNGVYIVTCCSAEFTFTFSHYSDARHCGRSAVYFRCAWFTFGYSTVMKVFNCLRFPGCSSIKIIQVFWLSARGGTIPAVARIWHQTLHNFCFIRLRRVSVFISSGEYISRSHGVSNCVVFVALMSQEACLSPSAQRLRLQR